MRNEFLDTMSEFQKIIQEKQTFWTYTQGFAMGPDFVLE